MAKFTKQARQISNALTLLYHHKIKPKVETAPDGSTQISFNAPTSMAAAYVENHLDEQLGPGFPFEVEAGGQKVYITTGNGKKAGNPHPKKAPSKRKRGGYRVCVRTVRNGWATWTKDKATGLSGPDADRLMRKLNRAGYQVAKFQGRTKVK